jgi:hypothetical protein
MFKYIIPLTISLFAGCVSNEPEENTECLYIFDRIINIQDIREASRKDFDITVQYKKKGKVSDVVWHREYHRWTDQESVLATSANTLYEQARANSCF